MKTIVKFFLKLLAGCLVVLAVAIFGLGVYSKVSPSNALHNLFISLGQEKSPICVSPASQSFGEEYTEPKIGPNGSNDAYTHILIAENKDLNAKYVNVVKLRVNELINKNDYDTALAILESAQKLLKNNDEIDKLYEEIKKIHPDKLCDLTIVESNDNYIPITEQKVMTDTVGNTYDSDNLFMLKTYGDDSGYAKYYLGGKYKFLQLTYAISTEDSDNAAPTTFTVLGNGDKILFTSGEMTRTTEPTSVGIDVTGQKWIYIQVESESHDSVPVLMANPVLFE